MRTFLIFLATVVIAFAVMAPNHFKDAAHATEDWIAHIVRVIV